MQERCPAQSMERWMKEQEGEDCKPCLLAPVAQWYYSELQERGRDDLAQELEQAVTSDDGVAIAAVLDRIKEGADSGLRERLLEFDCALQTYRKGEP